LSKVYFSEVKLARV